MDSKGLTKENFFDDIEIRYPKAMAQFKTWLDQYKADNHWKELFNEQKIATGSYQSQDGHLESDYKWLLAPKFHELPAALQLGIFLQFGSGIMDPDLEKPPVERILLLLREGFNDVFTTIEGRHE